MKSIATGVSEWIKEADNLWALAKLKKLGVYKPIDTALPMHPTRELIDALSIRVEGN